MDSVSKDNTLAIVSEFNDNRIKVFSEPDNGIYDAMNKGIKLAKGEWLYFLGSDDFFYDTTVLDDVFREIYKEKDIDVIYGNVIANEYVYDGPFDFNKIQSKNICHQAVFYSYKVFFELGGYDLKYKALGDYDFNLKWFLNKKYKYIYIDKIIAYFSPNGFSSNCDDNFYDDLPIILLKLGIGKLKIKELKEQALNASVIKYNKHQYFNWFYFRSLYYIFRIFDLAKRRIFTSYK